MRAAPAADLEVTVQDLTGRPLAEAAVYVEVLDAGPPPQQPTIIDQVKKQFVPRVTVVQTGTSVWLPNSDNIRHSVYSFSEAKAFTLKLYSGRPSNPVLFDKPGLVVLGCNIHDHMVAWVLIVDTPYFGVTADAGKVKLSGLPPGSHRVNVWHPGLVGAPGTQTLELTDGPMPSLAMRIDAADVPVPLPGSRKAQTAQTP
jgi:plastocyanin